MIKEALDRLKDLSEHTIATFQAWDKNRAAEDLTEAAQEAVHELRKVAARLEMSLIAAERAGFSQTPIPIPGHRANPRRDQFDES